MQETAPQVTKFAVSVLTLDGQNLRVSGTYPMFQTIATAAPGGLSYKIPCPQGTFAASEVRGDNYHPTVAVVAALNCRLRAAKVQEARALWSGHATPASNST